MALISPFNLNMGRISGEVPVKQPARFWEGISCTFCPKATIFHFQHGAVVSRCFGAGAIFTAKHPNFNGPAIFCWIETVKCRLEMCQPANCNILGGKICKCSIKSLLFHMATIGKAGCPITEGLSGSFLASLGMTLDSKLLPNRGGVLHGRNLNRCLNVWVNGWMGGHSKVLGVLWRC